jgi:hypothetical protein
MIGSILYYKGYGAVCKLDIIGLQKYRMPEEGNVEMGSHFYISNGGGIISIISELAFKKTRD